MGRERWVFGPNFVPVVVIVMSVSAMMTYGYVAYASAPGVAPSVRVAGPDTTTASSSTTTAATTTTSSTSTSTTSTTSTTTTTTIPPSPGPAFEDRYVVPYGEVAPEAKQLAADIAYTLTTYEASERMVERLDALAPVSGIPLLVQATRPLTHSDSWSRGKVLYPQLGGLTDDRASVMVVVRQTVGSGPEASFSVVRTLDIRLQRTEWGEWRFDYLSSAGGTFDTAEDLALAHSVARDPRIEMSDSARLDILEGRISSRLLRLMADLADRASYGVTVLATGHPHNVFATDRLSHHSQGRAMDIYLVDGRPVVDDRGDGSTTMDLVEWLLAREDVLQVGGPWDFDGPSSPRSFTNDVHQDHIHVAIALPVETEVEG